MKKIKTLLVFLSFIIVLGVLNPVLNIAYANSNGLPFMVEPILPNNQDGETSNYISIVAEQDDIKQELEFKLKNESDEEQDIKIIVVDAYTSPNGVIQYVSEKSDNSKIENEDYKLSRYLTSENDTITLKQGETRTISTTLDVKDIEGTLLGGVSFSAIQAEEKQNQGDSSFSINNEINMVVGVMVDFGTKNETNFVIGEPFIDPMPAYYVVRLPVTLDSPLLVQGTELTYNVSSGGEELFNNKKEVDFSPYAKTNIALPFEHDEIERNQTYTIEGKLVYVDHDGVEQTKTFEQDFQYVLDKKDESKESSILKAPIDIGDNSIANLVIIVLSSLLLFSIVLYFYLRKVTKDKEDETETV